VAEFSPAVTLTLQHEGGYNYNAKTGECVNRGLTHWFLRAIGRLPIPPLPLSTHYELERAKLLAPDVSPVRMARDVEIEVVRGLTLDATEELYQQYFWEPIFGEQIEDQEGANKLFDLAVNSGIVQAVKFFQRAVNTLRPEASLKVDGYLGPKTIAAINACDPVALLGHRAGADSVGCGVRGQAEQFYLALAKEYPEDQAALPGWLARLDS
jgi:lysozyme family protein